MLDDNRPLTAVDDLHDRVVTAGLGVKTDRIAKVSPNREVGVCPESSQDACGVGCLNDADAVTHIPIHPAEGRYHATPLVACQLYPRKATDSLHRRATASKPTSVTLPTHSVASSARADKTGGLHERPQTVEGDRRTSVALSFDHSQSSSVWKSSGACLQVATRGRPISCYAKTITIWPNHARPRAFAAMPWERHVDDQKDSVPNQQRAPNRSLFAACGGVESLESRSGRVADTGRRQFNDRRIGRYTPE